MAKCGYAHCDGMCSESWCIHGCPIFWPMTDHDPQPRAIRDPSFLLDTVRAATAALYPEARIPETPMAEDAEPWTSDRKTDHSPGPWTSDEKWDDHDNCVAIRSGCTAIAGAFYLGGTDQAKANARVLAAACEMEEALDHVEAVMSIVPPRSHTKEYVETLHQVRAALAKARGETL